MQSTENALISLLGPSLWKVLPCGRHTTSARADHSTPNCAMLVASRGCWQRRLLPFLEIKPTEIFFLSYAHFPLLNLP